MPTRKLYALIVLLVWALAAVESWADSAAAYSARARDSYGRGAFQESRHFADLAVASNPNYASAYLIRATVLIRLDQYPEALKDLDTAFKLDPNLKDAYAHKNRSLCLIEAGNLPHALSEMKIAVAQNQHPDGHMYKLLGEIYYQLNRFDDARRSYTRAIELIPKDYWNYKERGDIFCELKNYQRAVDDYSKVIRMVPKESIGYRSRAKAYEQLGRKDLAAIDIKVAEQRSRSTGMQLLDLK